MLNHNNNNHVFKLRDYTFLLLSILVLFLGLLSPEKFTAIFVTAFFFLLALYNSKLAIIALLLYFPIRPFLVEVNLGFKWAGDLTIILLFFKVIYNNRKNIISLVRLHFFEWSFIGFCLLGAVVAYFTGVTLVAIAFQLRAFLITFLLFYIMKRTKINSEDVVMFLWSTIFVSIIISIHGLVEKLSLRQWLLPETWSNMPLSETNIIRIYGLTGNPNSLALYLGISIVIAFYLLQYVTGRSKVFVYSSLILFSGVFLLTYSRGTWLAIIFSLSLFILLTKKWKIVKQVIILSLLAFFIIYVPVTEFVSYLERSGGDFVNEVNEKRERPGITRVTDAFDEEFLNLSKSSGRLYFVEKGFEVFKDHPITGTGFGTFGDSATLTYSSPIYETYGIRSVIYEGLNFYSDNQYIQIIVQTGSIGVILFAMFLLGMLFLIWKCRETNKTFAYFMITLLLGTFILGLYYNIWEIKLFTLYYFLFLGYLVNQSDVKQLPDQSNYKEL